MHRHRTLLLRDAAKLIFKPAEKDIFWALRDVSFTIRRGETVGFIGANGAGKSTLLSLIAGTAVPNLGELTVQGRVSALLELGAGFHPDFTGRENIFINGSIMGLKRAELEARFDEIVAFSELDRFIDEPVRNYSSGMLARLGFSVASYVDPDILLIDEALSVGDQAFQEKCFARIMEFKKKGCTIIFVSHSLGTVRKLCDRVLLLSHNQLIADGPAQQVCSEYTERIAQHRLEPAVSPYDKERVPGWQRLVAALSLAALIGGVAFAAGRIVLSHDLDEMKVPASARKLSGTR